MPRTTRLAPGLASLLAVALVACSGGDSSRDAARAGTAADGPAEHSASVSPKNDSGMQGHVMVSLGSDSLTIKLEVLGLETGTEYPTRLHSGTCAEGGEVVAELTSPTVASVGLGSSLTELSPDVMTDDGSYFVQVRMPDGTPAACADVRKPAGG